MPHFTKEKQKRKRCSRPVFSTRRPVNLVDGKTYRTNNQTNTK